MVMVEAMVGVDGVRVRRREGGGGGGRESLRTGGADQYLAKSASERGISSGRGRGGDGRGNFAIRMGLARFAARLTPAMQ